MIIMGVDFNASTMTWVAVECGGVMPVLIKGGDIKLAETRDPASLAAFQKAAADVLAGYAPALVAIKEKPEKGRMSAGAAALKMEGLLLAKVTVGVDIVSGRRVSAQMETGAGLKVKQQGAFRAAVAAYNKMNSD